MATGGAFVVGLMMMGTAPVGVAHVPLSSWMCPTCLESTGTGWWHWGQSHCHKFCPNLALGIYCLFFLCPELVLTRGILLSLPWGWWSSEREDPMKSRIRIAGIWFLQPLSWALHTPPLSLLFWFITSGHCASIIYQLNKKGAGS